MSKDGKESAKDAEDHEEQPGETSPTETEEKSPETSDSDGDNVPSESSAELSSDNFSNTEQSNVDTINFIRLLANFAGAFLAMLSICMVLYVQTGSTSATSRGLLYATLLGWAVLPPCWFITEFRYIWPQLKKQGVTMLEFTHEQSLSRNLWFGIGAVLASLLFLVK